MFLQFITGSPRLPVGGVYVYLFKLSKQRRTLKVCR